MVGFDTYELRARVAPALLVALPVIVGSGLALADEVTRTAAGVTGFGALLVFAVIAEHVRDAGNRAQEALGRRWGGLPTTRRLRSGSADFRVAAAARSGRAVPTDFEWQLDRISAERNCDEIIAILRGQPEIGHATRVAQENLAYGFRRNVYALRLPGACMSAASAIASTIWLRHGPHLSSLVAFSLATGLLFWWSQRNDGWVLTAANRYADALEAAVMVAHAADTRSGRSVNSR